MILNVLTRTHREAYFKVCRQSVLSQTAVESINWIVGSDIDCQYYPAIKLHKDSRMPVVPQGHYYAPHNLHLNTLQEYVREDYVMYLDDDDIFTNEKSAKRILNACEENSLLVWRVQITPNWIVPSKSFGHMITPGDFSGIGMCFHSKHLPVNWGDISYGDYRVAMQLLKKGLKIKWVDMILTQTQKGPNNGRP